MPLSSSIASSIKEINNTSPNQFRPDRSHLLLDLLANSDNSSGIIAIPSQRPRGYDLSTLSPSAHLARSIEAVGIDLWECAKEHYGLTGSFLLTGVSGIPISKTLLGHSVFPGTSRYTNIISHAGIKFFPRLLLSQSSIAARIAKNTLGTIRVFGILGRAAPWGAIGLGIIDAVLIGKCAYDERNKA